MPTLRRRFCTVSGPPSSANPRPSSLANAGVTTNERGITIEHFKDVFREPGPKFRRRQYKLRWDWHLRQFLLALLPPTALWLFLKAVEYSFQEEYAELRKIMEENTAYDEESTKEAKENMRKLRPMMKEHTFRHMVERRIKQLEQEVVRLRNEKEVMMKEKADSAANDGSGNTLDPVMEARRVAKGIVRATASAEPTR